MADTFEAWRDEWARRYQQAVDDGVLSTEDAMERVLQQAQWHAEADRKVANAADLLERAEAAWKESERCKIENLGLQCAAVDAVLEEVDHHVALGGRLN